MVQNCAYVLAARGHVVIQRRTITYGTVAATVLLVVVGVYLFSTPIRLFEAAIALDLSHLAGLNSTVESDYQFQILPGRAQWPFRAQLTPYCSSAIVIATLLSVAVCVLPGRFGRRMGAFALGAIAVFVGNVLRIALALVGGATFGPSGLTLLHDWVGTVCALLYTLLGFFLMLWFLMPKQAGDVGADAAAAL